MDAKVNSAGLEMNYVVYEMMDCSLLVKKDGTF